MKKIYKKGMRFDFIFIGFLLFTGIIFAGIMMINDFEDSYEFANVSMAGASDQFGDVYNTIDDVNDIGALSKNSTYDSDISNTDSTIAMTKGAYSAMRLIPRSFELMRGIANAIASTMKIKCDIPGQPDSKSCFFVDLAYIAFVISVVFSFIYMLFHFIPS